MIEIVLNKEEPGHQLTEDDHEKVSGITKQEAN
jgi:hypothetical protein